MDIEQVLKQCKFSRRYQGYRALLECLKITIKDEERLLYLTGIYYDVGNKIHLSWNGVERNIRTLFDNSWDNGGKEQLEELAGGVFYEKPTVGGLIEILTCYIKEHVSD